MNILLITDDSAIISMVKHALKKSYPDDRLFVARSGNEGIEFLNKSLNSQLDLVPSIIIIDLDSMEANGLYLIQRVTTDLRIEDAQVAVLTSPLEPRDSDLFQRLELDCVIDKPLDHKVFHDLFESLSFEGDDESEAGQRAVKPYRPVNSEPVQEVEGLCRVLVVEPSANERKRFSQGMRKSSTALELLFANTAVMAKKRVRSESYAVVIVSVDDADTSRLEDLLATCRERGPTPVIAIVDQAHEDAGRAAVMAGANVYLVRDSGNYLNVLNELVSSIAERRRLEILSKRAVDADREMLREVIERAPLMMLRIDDKFAIRDCNETFSTATKQLRHALIGRHVFDILPDLEVLPMISALEDGMPYSREGYRMKTIGQSHSATTYWDLHVWSIRRSLSSGPEAILIAADVSGRIELEQQRERFVAALAHDIRNPLVGGQRVIDSLLGGKHGELEPPRARQLITSLHKSNQSLLMMLSNLIDVYKYETDAMSLQFRSIHLDDLVREQLQEIAHIAATAEIQFVADIEERLPTLSGDINAIRRLLMNLFYNALKYGVPKTNVEIRVYSVLGCVNLRVKNKGNPITGEKMRNLFRSVVGGVPIKHGSGLGLYLCRKIIEAHNAGIECKSTADSGTEFLIRFRPETDDFKHSDFSQSAG